VEEIHVINEVRFAEVLELIFNLDLIAWHQAEVARFPFNAIDKRHDLILELKDLVLGFSILCVVIIFVFEFRCLFK